MFEGMLARRYIGAQKRHSALTVCSIAIALALITMLFSVFSTAISVLRNIAYNEGEYHIRIMAETGTSYGLDKEQYDAIAEAASEYGTCTAEDIMVSGKSCFFANILLDKDIGSMLLFISRIEAQTGIKRLIYYTNDLLMLCDMRDTQSQLYMAGIVAAFYVFVLFLIMMLRLIIDTAFEISSKERERQFGVLQSIGATPKQIVRMITYEGLMLSVIGIPLGTAAGIGLAYIAYRAVLGTGLANLYLTPSKAAELVHFYVNPWLLILGVVTGLVWVMLSAYGTGMRVIKMSPVQAISQRTNVVKKVRRTSLFGKLFGWTGKIASRNNMRQPKRFFAAVVSLTLSISLFSAVTVIVNDLNGFMEDFANEYGTDGDFRIYPYEEEGNPFYYRAALNKLEESGLFADIPFSLNISAYYYLSDTHNGAYIEYYNRKSYNDLFGSDPPVSYDELAESGRYIIDAMFADELGSDKSASLYVIEKERVYYSEEEYNALPPEEQEKCDSNYRIDDEMTYGYYPLHMVDLDIYRTADLGGSRGVIATLDQYENGEYSLFTNSWMSKWLTCELADTNDYYNALDFFELNSIEYYDNSAEYRQFRAVLASVNIVTAFLSIMIALIAIVNMVNILATGILNRRGELAALQCVGMTEKGLYKMTVIECLQYALTSGIAAVIVCELMMFLTEKMLYIVREFVNIIDFVISYVQPLPIIGIASLCAFVIAIAASVIPLRAMRKTSLVEQIRSVE